MNRTFEYRLPEKLMGVWKDEHGYMWEYGQKNEKVMGEVRRKAKVETQDVMVSENHQICITPVSRRTGIFERTVGYLPCTLNGEEGCIAIVDVSWMKLIITAVAVFMLIAGAVVALTGYPHGRKTDEVIHLELPDILHNDDPTGYTIPDYTAIDKNVHNERTDTWLVNVNDNICDISYEIYIDGSSSPIYSSPVLGEGDVIKGMTLEDDLTVGDYSYTMICTLYSPGTQDVIGEQTMEGVLHVYDES